jgi:hypothetical protein
MGDFLPVNSSVLPVRIHGRELKTSERLTSCLAGWKRRAIRRNCIRPAFCSCFSGSLKSQFLDQEDRMFIRLIRATVLFLLAFLLGVGISSANHGTPAAPAVQAGQ